MSKAMPKTPQASPRFEELLTAYGNACLLGATADATGQPKKTVKSYQLDILKARDDVVRYVDGLERRS